MTTRKKKTGIPIEGEIPSNPEALEFWIDFAKNQVKSTINIYFDTVKVFLQVSSIALSVFLGSVSFMGTIKPITFIDLPLVMLVVLSFLVTIIYGAISLLGGAYRFDILRPNTIETWYVNRLKIMRKRTMLLTIFFILSILLMVGYWGFLIFR